MMVRDPRISLPKHTLVIFRGKLYRTISHENTGRGEPGIGRIQYTLEPAVVMSDWTLKFGVFMRRAGVKAKDITVVADQNQTLFDPSMGHKTL